MGKPKIRFKGYADDWEQRKVSELLYLSNEKNDGSYTRDDVLAASLGTELQKKHIYFGLRATDESVKNYKVVLPKDVIYTKSPIKGFPNGIIRTNKGETGIVPTLYCVYHSIDTINPSIIQAYFESKERLDAYLVPLVNIGARNNVNITDKEFINGSICIPKNETEQNRIVDLLEKISNLITLHQRKCDETKKLKKYMLQKMFPQNGEKVPKIRFAGFSDDWEQRKFSELYVRSSEKNDGSIGMDKNITVATMQFKEDVQVSTAEYLKTYYTFNLGDIAFEGHQSKEFRYGRFVENDIGNGIVSHIFAVFRPIQEYDLYFWKYAINNETLMQRILGRSTKASTMMHDLVANDFLNETFLVPSIDEQKQIGSLFNKLDHLITLHQQKCDELQNIKKFMLKNMFA